MFFLYCLITASFSKTVSGLNQASAVQMPTVILLGSFYYADVFNSVPSFDFLCCRASPLVRNELSLVVNGSLVVRMFGRL